MTPRQFIRLLLQQAASTPIGWKAALAWARMHGPANQAVRYGEMVTVAHNRVQHNVKLGRAQVANNWRKRRRHVREKKQEAEAAIPVRSPDRRVISRSEWGARAPRSRVTFASDDQGVFVHHSVTRTLSPNASEAEERAEMRNIQAIAFSRGFQDISYSFVVFPSGRIYEGRGRFVVGGHTAGFNSSSHAICAAGNFEATPPTEAMVGAIRWTRRTHLHAGDKQLRGHRQVAATACPGKHLFARLGDL